MGIPYANSKFAVMRVASSPIDLDAGSKAQPLDKLCCFVSRAKIELIGVGANAHVAPETLALDRGGRHADHKNGRRYPN